jgi:CRP-like cAMP-binding protein
MLDKNNYFGERAVMLGETRSAMVVAKTEVELF